MSSFFQALLRNPSYRQYLFNKAKAKAGYSSEQLARVVYIEEWRKFFAAAPIERWSCLEISPHGRSIWREMGFRTYDSVDFPEFDITTSALDRTFDVIIAEQVFEHLRHPYVAARNVHKMLAEEGVFMTATPFLIRVHGAPDDFTRWTEHGLASFLEDCGFQVETRSWGNRKAVVANFNRWSSYGWRRDLRNEPDFPVSVWAYARKKR